MRAFNDTRRLAQDAAVFLLLFFSFGARAQQTPQSIPLTSGACKLDGTVGCGSGGGGGSGDVTDVNITMSPPLTGSANCASGACSFTLGLGTVTIAKGGTNITSYTLGDVLYSSAANTLAALAGNTTATRKFLRQTGNGSVSAAPAWDTLVAGDVPTLNQNTTGNAATATALAANPTDCSAGTKATAIDASGNLTCSAVSLTADVTGVLPAANLGSGSGGATKFLREDSTFQTIPGGGDALTSSPLSQFASTTSSQLAGVISDETGSGALCFATSPSFTTPSLGVATATSINGTTIPTSKTIVTGTAGVGQVALWTASDAISGDAGCTFTGSGSAFVLSAANLQVTTNMSPATAAGTDAGTSTLPWRDIYLAGSSGTPGTNKFKITGASTSGLRTITLPDASGTVYTSGNKPALTADVTGVLPVANGGVAATQRLALINQLWPDSSGNVFWEPYPVKATNDFWKHGHLVFNDTATKDSAYGVAMVPPDYVGSAVVRIVWTSTATSGNVVWEFAYRDVGGDDTTSLDQSTAQETVTVTDAAPTATDRRLVTTVSLTSANLTAGDTLEFKFSRDGSSGSDTMAAAAQLVGVFLEYNVR